MTYEEKMDLYKKARELVELDEKIREDIKKSRGMKRELLEILIDMEDYERKEFLYNNGRFRTKEEIDKYNYRKKLLEEQKKYEQKCEEGITYASSGQYKEDSGSPLLAWIPFIINVILIPICWNNSHSMDSTIISVILLPITLTITLILMLSRDKKIIKLGDEHCVPKDDKTYQKAKMDLTSGRIAGTGAAIHSLHNISKGFKDITNPSGWHID